MAEAFIVIGLGYGDEGKGSVVDYLTRQYAAHTVVRFNGGAQAAHNVVTPDGKHHTFAQFGSGTLAGARTHLSRFMLVNPLDFWLEEKHLIELGVPNPRALVTISPAALVTTPLHILANQMKEERRDNEHGTCGKGIGETQETAILLEDSAIRVKDLRWAGVVERKLEQLSDYYGDTLSRSFPKTHGDIPEIARAYKVFAEKVNIEEDLLIRDLQGQGQTLIFEGAQGIMLDEEFGFHPHTTWSKTTSQNAHKLLDPMTDSTTIGVTRPYLTRHGRGPIPGTAGGYLAGLREPHNEESGFQGMFRYGRWDDVAMGYAAKCDDIDAVAVTCFDHIADIEWDTVSSYEYLGDMPDLHPYFETDGKKHIFSIEPSTVRAHSEAITNRIWRCSWNIEQHGLVDSDYVTDHIRNVIGAPVAIESYGPTYRDKKTLLASRMLTRNSR